MEYAAKQEHAKQEHETLISRVAQLEKQVEELRGRERNLTPRVADLEKEVLRPDRPVAEDVPF